jgi:hypothetical protein
MVTDNRLLELADIITHFAALLGEQGAADAALCSCQFMCMACN